MRKQSFLVVIFLLVLLVFSNPLLALDDPAANPGAAPAVTQVDPGPTAAVIPEKLAPGVYRIGLVELDKAKRSLSFPVRINMDKGLLEYLLVRRGGKTHESLFLTEAQPYNIQLAGLLLDMEGTDKPLPYQGAAEVPTGEPLELSVAVIDEEGRTQHYRPESWVRKVTNGNAEPVDKLDWVFTGSMIVNGHFLAQAEGSVIALYRDPVAIVDNGSPGGDNDEIWFVNEETVPPIGTAAVLTIQVAK